MNKKNKTKLMLLLLTVLILGGIVYTFVSVRNEVFNDKKEISKKENSEPVTDDNQYINYIELENTYENETMGISFQYPENTEILVKFGNECTFPEKSISCLWVNTNQDNIKLYILKVDNKEGIVENSGSISIDLMNSEVIQGENITFIRAKGFDSPSYGNDHYLSISHIKNINKFNENLFGYKIYEGGDWFIIGSYAYYLSYTINAEIPPNQSMVTYSSGVKILDQILSTLKLEGM